MITFIRTGSISQGKTREALAFAHQMAKIIKEKFGTTLEIALPIGGNPNRIAWHGRFESLAQWESLSAKLATDADCQAAIAQNSATFLPGSIHDEFWRTL